MIAVKTFAWPLSRLGEAIEALARASHLEPRDVETPIVPRTLIDATRGSFELEVERALERWVSDAAEWLGVEAEAVDASYAEIPELVEGSAPALLRVHVGAEVRFFAVLRRVGRHLVLVAQDHSTLRVPRAEVERALAEIIEAPYEAEVEHLLEVSGVAASRRPRARRALLAARLSGRRVSGSFVLRLPPSASFVKQARAVGLFKRFGLLVGAHAVEYVLFIGSWAMIGRGALGGRIDRGYLLGWALLLLTVVPIRLLVSWTSGRLAIEAGALMKQRLLTGALALDPEDLRTRGAGQLFGRVIESEAVEALALGGGIVGVISVLEVGMSAVVLASGVAPGPHLLALAVWVGFAILLAARYYRVRGAWTTTRLEMTHDLVERMVGHRTRLAQESPERWHEGEDLALDRYLERSGALDSLMVVLGGLFPRGWLLVGLALVVPAFASGRATSGALAITLGGIVLTQRSLQKLLGGLSDMAGAAISWREVKPLFDAAGNVPPPAHPDAALASGSDEVLVDAHDLTFRYSSRAMPVLRGTSLQIRRGERILVEGASGSGKSTLGALLAGLREAESGLLLLCGLDLRTLGIKGFRRRVVAAPQFHDNHVISATFAFNLLMGRAWPATPEDYRAATDICNELELGPLLSRMPAGLMQMVGETGWQLSHGERSRLFMARALLQGADLVVLDESFAALDPETLKKAMECALARAKTLLVIAHP